MKESKNFLQNAKEIFILGLFLFGEIVAIIIFIVICVAIGAINLFLSLFGKKINFNPFAALEKDFYGYKNELPIKTP